jgi:hypothetical protein
MTFEQFDHLASGLQAIAFVAAVSVGAMWALFRFRRLLFIKRARIEFDKLEASLHASPSIEIHVSHSANPNTSGCCLLVDVSIENRGVVPEVLDASEILLYVAKTEPKERDKITMRHIAFCSPSFLDPDIHLTSHEVGPGSVFHLPFLVLVPGAGVYYLSFRAQASPRETNHLLPIHACLGKNPKYVWWTSAQYYEVKEHSRIEEP